MLKIFLLTKNESSFIEDWIKYHGHLFGLENIHVLDGSNEKATLDVYSKFTPLGLNVHYSSAGLNDACQELNSLMHDNKGVDNFLIKLDTDEFLAYTEPFDLDPQNYFDRFLQKGCLANRKKTWVLRKMFSEKVMSRRLAQKTIMTHNINERLAKLPITGQRYKASLTAWSLPTQKANPRPCRNLTSFTPIQFTHLKSFFHSSSFVSVDLGCHGGVTSQNAGVIHTGLTTVHYHSTSVEDSVKRAKQALLSHGYFEDGDNLQQQKDKLVQLRASGEVSSFHKVDLYLNYLKSKEKGVLLPPSSLNMYHPYFSSTGVPKKISIIKDTLEHIDTLGLYDVT